MKQRVITGIVMALVGLPILFLGGYVFGACLLVLAYVGSVELFRTSTKPKNLPSAYPYVLATLPTFFILLSICKVEGLFGISLNHQLLFLLCTGVCFLILGIFTKKITIKDVFFYLFVFLYIGISFSFMYLIRQIHSNDLLIHLGNYTIEAKGLILFTFILLSTMCTDIGAYQFGMKFGKHKMAPLISPHKSWEGAISGSVFGMIMGGTFLLVLELVCDFTLFSETSLVLEIIFDYALALCITVIGQIGDLVASMIKREHEIKDYGNIFPGHGGVMDRMDSIILTMIFSGIIFVVFGILLL